MDIEKLIAFFASNNPNQPWKKNIQDATLECFNLFKGIIWKIYSIHRSIYFF